MCLDVREGDAAKCCLSAKDEVVDKLQERTSRHAHAATLVGLLLEGADGSQRRLAVRMDVQMEGEWEDGHGAGNGLQLGGIDSLCAADAGTDEGEGAGQMPRL